MPTASLRAPEGYHLVDIMQSCVQTKHDLFLRFGGHPGAAGFSLLKENLRQAKDLMSSHVKPNTKKPIKYNQNVGTPEEWNHLTYKKNIIWIDVEKLNINLLNQVFELDPFGQDFTFPSFGFELGQKDILNFTLIGNSRQHLKIESKSFKILSFSVDKKMVEWLKCIKGKIWIIAKPHKNSFRQVSSIDLVLEKFYIIENL